MTALHQTASRENPLWIGAAAGRSERRLGLLRSILAFFIPPKGQKVVPTRAGVILIMVALGIGVAAYNTSSNILFIALSLLLSTIIVSGLLSWINFRRSAWRVSLQPPFRAGETAVVGLEVFNGKRVLPTYSLGFDFKTSSGEKGKLTLRSRLDPGATRRMEWTFRPGRRGRELVEMAGVSSQFPFGFLQKSFGGRIAQEVYVWPARVRYKADLSCLSVPESNGDVLNRAGSGSEFINLRGYQRGDSFRQVHWKVTARAGKIMVRQPLAEHQTGLFLHLETPASTWRRPEQFEKLCGFAAALAEDLFREQRLAGAVINDGAPLTIRRLADLELLLDQIAVLEPLEHYRPGRSLRSPNIIRFEPAMPDGVHAYLRGQKAATA
ncbi:MAG TPA: DUF58 domain-containing protein [Opitutaceae bacterium]